MQIWNRNKTTFWYCFIVKKSEYSAFLRNSEKLLIKKAIKILRNSMGTCSNSWQFVSCSSPHVQVNSLKYIWHTESCIETLKKFLFLVKAAVNFRNLQRSKIVTSKQSNWTEWVHLMGYRNNYLLVYRIFEFAVEFEFLQSEIKQKLSSVQKSTCIIAIADKNECILCVWGIALPTLVCCSD